MSRYTPAVVVMAGLWILTAGCAGSNKKLNWRGSMSSYFENTSVKPGEPPRRLWDTADEELLLRRMGYADTVAVGTVRLVSGFEHRGKAGQLALAFRAREVLYGSIDKDKDSDGELRLRLDPSAADYSLARKVQKQLPSTHYLLFLKRRPRKDGSHDLRWAFYRPRRKLMAEVRARYRWLKKAGDRFRVHEQREQEQDDVSIGELLETPKAREPRSADSTASTRSQTTSTDEPGFLGQQP